MRGTVQSMLILFDVTAINGQAYATNHKKCIRWKYLNCVRLHNSLSCQMELFKPVRKSEILPDYAYCLDHQSALLLVHIKFVKHLSYVLV